MRIYFFFALVFLTQQNFVVAQNLSKFPLDELRMFSNIFEQIKRDYVEEIQDKKLLMNAMKGMVDGLDPHSSLLEKEDFLAIKENTQGEFAGIGIEIMPENNLVKIINIIENTPAAQSILQPGDFITHINEKSIRGMGLDKIIQYIRGPIGKKVTLTVFRKNENRILSSTIVRNTIKVQAVKIKEIIPGIIWLRIINFQDQIVPELTKKLKQLSASTENSIKGLILDLRNNGGGLLESAVGISEFFLPSNVVIVSIKGRSEGSEQIFKSGNCIDIPKIYKDIKMIVLVNAFSASASEIVAGALQDHKRAIILGKTTFGKGSVQTVRQLNNEIALKLTTAYYYTPSGKSIQSFGIQPDIIVNQNQEGDQDDALFMREINNEKHLHNKQSSEDQLLEIEKKRLEKLQNIMEKSKNEFKENDVKKQKILEFGTKEDFMLQQAILYFQDEIKK